MKKTAPENLQKYANHTNDNNQEKDCLKFASSLDILSRRNPVKPLGRLDRHDCIELFVDFDGQYIMIFITIKPSNNIFFQFL